LNAATKGAFYFFSVVYFVLTFIPPFIGVYSRFRNFKKPFMILVAPLLIFTTSFQLTMVIAPCKLRRQATYLGSNEEIRAGYVIRSLG